MIKLYEKKKFIKRNYCDFCGEGEYLPVPQEDNFKNIFRYKHLCDNCGRYAYFKDVYPIEIEKEIEVKDEYL